MSIYFITGQLGGGKTLGAVHQIQNYLKEGKPVATNLDLNLEKLISPWSKESNVTRLPDTPTVKDLNDLGFAHHDYDESNNGALVFDECASWFSSGNWKDENQKAVNNWLRYARKRGWDVYFIVQHIELISGEARKGLLEYYVECRRTDKISVPILSPIKKMITGKRMAMPKYHFCTVYYGKDNKAIKAERWVFKGVPLYGAYDTKQIFTEKCLGVDFKELDPYFDYTHHKYKVHQILTTRSSGARTFLPPYYVYGRYNKKRSWKDKIQSLIKITIQFVVYLIANYFAVKKNTSPGQLLKQWGVISTTVKPRIVHRPVQRSGDNDFDCWVIENESKHHWREYHESGDYKVMSYMEYLYCRFCDDPQSWGVTILPL